MAHTQEGAAHGQVDHGHESGPKLYLMTWVWLLVITVLEVGVVLVNVPRLLLVPILLVMTALKVLLIVANFMHVRYEKLNLLYVIVTPMVLALIMWYGISPDF